MKIFSLEIKKLYYQQFIEEITSFLESNAGGKGKSIFTPNPEICLKTLSDNEFLALLKQADYLTSDGIGLYLAYQINDTSKLGAFFLLPYFLFNVLFRKKHLYKRYGERVCGSDLTHSLLNYCQDTGTKIAIIDPFFPQDAAKCASQEVFREKLSEKFPNLLFDFYIYSEENSDEILAKIAASDAKVLFSTLGMKRQEVSVIKALESCPNIQLGLGVGSSFDYFTGFQKRAPQIWRTLGFEWLYRIFTSPGKLKRLGRIYQALIVFPIKVIFYK